MAGTTAPEAGFLLHCSAVEHRQPAIMVNIETITFI
jgi:hypothetical protein